MIKTMHRVAIYLRISTFEQTTANQERELREVASRMGCEVILAQSASSDQQAKAGVITSLLLLLGRILETSCATPGTQ
jgi:hypothetical protein